MSGSSNTTVVLSSARLSRARDLLVPAMQSIPSQVTSERRDRIFTILVELVVSQITHNANLGSAIRYAFYQLDLFVKDTPFESAWLLHSNRHTVVDTVMKQVELSTIRLTAHPSSIHPRLLANAAFYPLVNLAKNELTVARRVSTFRLNSLPADIQLVILDTLRDQGDWRSILSLRSVNKHWLRITKSFVFIGFNSAKTGHIDDQWTDSPIHRVSLMLGQPFCRPEFIKALPTRAAMKRSWTFTKLDNNLETCLRLHQQLTDLGLPSSLNKSILLEVLDSKQDIERRASQASRADAELAMVLATCTGLEKLELPDIVTEKFGPLSREVISYAARSPTEDGEVRMLGKLKHLELADMREGIEVADMLDMLSLPKIKDLRIWCPVDRKRKSPRDIPSPEDMPRLPNQNLVNLTLLECHALTDDGLTRILAACPRVRTLFIHSPVGMGDPNPPFPFTGALEKYGNSLEFLWLETQCGGPGLIEDTDESRRFLRALSSMRNLRTLVLWRGDFDSAESLGPALPTSLRELLIIGDTDVIETDENGEPRVTCADRVSLIALREHPRLVNLERVEVVSTNAFEGRYFWRTVFDYCMECRRLPPHLLDEVSEDSDEVSEDGQ
ncbi:hypothetical protein Hte_004901 [Hypoxylon texense]